jgi:hypothetical protein
MYCHVENKLTGKVYLYRVTYAQAENFIMQYRGGDKRYLVIR